MSRRSRSKSSGKNNIVIYAIIGVAIIATIVVGKVFLQSQTEHFSKVSDLPIEDFRRSARSLSGNEFRVTGEISEKLKWTADRGQVISLIVEDAQTDSVIIPIKIPSGIDSINLERGRRYIFKVEVDREGLPIANDVKAL